MSTYAIIKTGGKQYRVEQGQSLLVERLPAGDGESVTLQPLLYVDGSDVVDGDDLARVSVEARVVAHERGPKLRVVKFKPKRGYKRRTGHRQELTRIEVTSLGLSSGGSSRSRASKSGGGSRSSSPKPVAADQPAAAAAPAQADAPEAAAAPAQADAPEAAAAPAQADAPTTAPSSQETENGS